MTKPVQYSAQCFILFCYGFFHSEYSFWCIPIIFILGIKQVLWLHINFYLWESGQNGSFDVEGCRALAYTNIYLYATK